MHITRAIRGLNTFNRFDPQQLVDILNERVIRTYDFTDELTGDQVFDVLALEHVMLPTCMSDEHTAIYIQRNQKNQNSFLSIQAMTEVNKSDQAQGWLLFFRDMCLMGDHSLNLTDSAHKIFTFVDASTNVQTCKFDHSALTNQLQKKWQDKFTDITNYALLSDIHAFVQTRRDALWFMIKKSYNRNRFEYFLNTMSSGMHIPENCGFFGYTAGKVAIGMVHVDHHTAFYSIDGFFEASLKDREN